MEKFKQIAKDVFTSNKAKTFYWQTGVGFVGLLTSFAVTIQPDVLDPRSAFVISALIAGLNMITKHINKTYL